MARVLVVEDDALIRRLIEDERSESGHAVQSAADGAAALDVVANEKPAAIVLDPMLPVVRGWTYRAISGADGRPGDPPSSWSRRLARFRSPWSDWGSSGSSPSRVLEEEYEQRQEHLGHADDPQAFERARELVADGWELLGVRFAEGRWVFRRRTSTTEPGVPDPG